MGGQRKKWLCFFEVIREGFGEELRYELDFKEGQDWRQFKLVGI